MLEAVLAASMLLACLVLIQVIKKPEIRKSPLSPDHTDIIKGVSIFLIIVSHIGLKAGLTYMNPFGFTSNAAFLICAGLGLQKSYEKNGLKGFFMKRLVRIMIPYWIAMAAHFIIHPSEFSLINLARAVLLIKTYEYWWFIQFIVVSYILFYIIYRFVPDKFRLPCVLLLSAVFFAVEKNDLMAAQAFSIPVGILSSKYLSKMKLSDKNILIGSLLSLILGASMLAAKRLPLIHGSIYLVYNAFQVLISLFLAIALIGLIYTLMQMFLVRMLAAAGRASYELYIIHTLLIFMITNRMTVMNVALYIITFGAAAIVFYYLNKFIVKALSGPPAKAHARKLS